MARPNSLIDRETGLSHGWDILSYAVLALGGLILASGLCFALFGLPGSPSFGQWFFLTQQARGGTAHAIWAQYEHHRLGIPGLLIALDQTIAGGRNWIVLCTTAGSQLALIVLYARLFRETELAGPADRRVLVGLICAAVLLGGHINIYVIPYRSWAALTIFFAVLSTFLLDRAVRREGSRNFAPLIGGSLVSGAAATLSGAPGILVWPTLLLVAMAARARLTTFLLLLLGGTVISAVYYAGYGFSVSGPGGTALLAAPARILLSSCYYLGAPFVRPLFAESTAHIAVPGAAVLGGIGLLGGLALIVRRLVFQRPETPLDSLCLGTVIFSLGWTAAIVIKHTQAPPLRWSLVVAPAYFLSVMWFWAALAIQSLRLLAKRRRPDAARKMLFAICLLVLLGLIPTHLFFGMRAVFLKQIAEFSALAAAAGVVDAELEGWSPSGSPGPGANPEKAVAWLKRHRLPPFDSEPARSIGQSISVLGPLPDVRCAGAVDGRRRLQAPPGFRLWGHWETVDPERRVAVIDEHDTITGIGKGWQSPAYQRWLALPRIALHEGWLAYTRAAPAGRYRVVGIAADGTLQCLFEPQK